MNCDDHLTMWSSVVLFVLTFAVLGLLLGFAAVYQTNQQGDTDNGRMIQENVTTNVTQGSQPSNAITNAENGQ
jgi:heme/copper-type cytochrome/quinol oxidase subunit 2